MKIYSILFIILTSFGLSNIAMQQPLNWNGTLNMKPQTARTIQPALPQPQVLPVNPVFQEVNQLQERLAQVSSQIDVLSQEIHSGKLNFVEFNQKERQYNILDAQRSRILNEIINKNPARSLHG